MDPTSLAAKIAAQLSRSCRVTVADELNFKDTASAHDALVCIMTLSEGHSDRPACLDAARRFIAQLQLPARQVESWPVIDLCKRFVRDLCPCSGRIDWTLVLRDLSSSEIQRVRPEPPMPPAAAPQPARPRRSFGPAPQLSRRSTRRCRMPPVSAVSAPQQPQPQPQEAEVVVLDDSLDEEEEPQPQPQP